MSTPRQLLLPPYNLKLFLFSPPSIAYSRRGEMNFAKFNDTPVKQLASKCRLFIGHKRVLIAKRHISLLFVLLHGRCFGAVAWRSYKKSTHQLNESTFHRIIVLLNSTMPQKCPNTSCACDEDCSCCSKETACNGCKCCNKTQNVGCGCCESGPCCSSCGCEGNTCKCN